MSKILDVNEMLEASRRLNLKDHAVLEEQLVDAAERLRSAIARKLKIKGGDTSSQELEFAGLCGSFSDSIESKWPAELSDLDPSGELAPLTS